MTSKFLTLLALLAFFATSTLPFAQSHAQDSTEQASEEEQKKKKEGEEEEEPDC